MKSDPKELSREELYDLVWSTPMASLAIELGISDVALKKRCRRQSIPTPGRGYWAKVEAGKKVARPKLPQTIGGAEPQVPISTHHTQWPRDVLGLCARAQALITELENLKPDYHGLQSLRHSQFPKVEVTKPLIESAARLFHALIFSVEATGVPLRKSRSKYEGAHFEVQGERLYLEINEVLKEESTLPSWRQKRQGSGKLSLTLTSDYYGRGWKESWSQVEDGGVREIVASATTAITAYYADRAKQRAEEAEKHRIEHERWLKEEEMRKKRNHEQALLNTAQQRDQDFLLAVEWAHLHERALAFIIECETRWKKDAPELTADKIDWLQWARTAAEAWSPWLTGYPDPTRDGAFNPEQVTFGGPYPVTRKFPRPPTMPEIRSEPASQFQYHQPSKESSPLRLRNPR